MRNAKRSALIGLSGLTLITMFAAAFFFYGHTQAASSGTTGSTRNISAAGTATLVSGGNGVDGGVQSPEFAPSFGADDAGNHDGGTTSSPLKVPHVKSSPIATSNPELNLSFNGLNHRNQRLANGGNQFSLEPPDQGLCAGNGFVMETINDVLRVYDTAGNALTGVVDLNTFFGYPAAFKRPAGPFGPFVTDPSCYFDPDTQRWFTDVLTLDVFPDDGNFTGTNHLDFAVSKTADPTGAWTVYHLPVQDDGTQGTPNHGCSTGPARRTPTNPHACLGDYPHIGADANGFYITTNEYSFFGPEFKAAQIYAFSKHALASGAATVAVTQFNTVGALAGNPGFTVWPATAPASRYAKGAHGTEFFLSSMAAPEANNTTGMDNRLGIWALTNTQSLDSASPAVQLQQSIVRVETYGIPPRSDQKAGDTPLAQCVNDTTTLILGLFTGCWQAIFVNEPAHNAVESRLDSNDSRMQQVVYADGQLWGALDTIVNVDGQTRAGIAWFSIHPEVEDGAVRGSVNQQGYIAVKDNNVTYPAIAVLPSGEGVMAFTLVGQDFYPSAGYVTLKEDGPGAIHVAAAGLGPQDGFSGYDAFSDPPGSPARPRWGDYGAAVVVGSNIWIASEYIGQTCTFAQYISAPFGSCGGTRTTLANWGTRISEVTPSFEH